MRKFSVHQVSHRVNQFDAFPSKAIPDVHRILLHSNESQFLVSSISIEIESSNLRFAVMSDFLLDSLNTKLIRYFGSEYRNRFGSGISLWLLHDEEGVTMRDTEGVMRV
jgi:hypothetical protein